MDCRAEPPGVDGVILEMVGDDLVAAKEILGLSNFKDLEGDNPGNREDSPWLSVGARDVLVDALPAAAGADVLRRPLVESLDEDLVTKEGATTE